MDSRTVIRLIKAEGWFLDRVVGSHHHFRHAERRGTTTVVHPARDFKIKTLRSMERQSGVKLRNL